MVYMIEPISNSNQCSTTGITKAVICTILSVGHMNNLLIGKISSCSGSGFHIFLSQWYLTISDAMYL